MSAPLGSDGFITKKGTPDDRRSAIGTPQFGWRYDMGYKFWVLESEPTGGTVCALTNVAITRNFGSSASPVPMSIISTGSVYLTGSPFIKPSDPSGALIVAGGDLQMSGSASTGSANYEGMLYAQSQCKFTGNPRIAGQVICKNDPTPAGAYEITATNDIAGNPEITYSCTDAFGKRRRVAAWYPTFGQNQ